MIRAKNIARDWRLDPAATYRDLRESLALGRVGETGGISVEEFSLRDLAEELIFDRDGGESCGYRFVKEVFDPTGTVSVQESMSAVDSTAFANITGQLLVSKVLEGYRREEFVASSLIPAQPTRLDGEKIPGVAHTSDPGNDRMTVREGQDYPTFGFGEEYVETPSTTKRGLIIPVTKEAVFFDRTGLVTRRAAEVGEILGLNKEKRLLDVMIGATENYRRNGTALDTFYAAADTDEPWVNHLDNNALVDWTSIDAAEQLFAEMTDPNTNEPILIGGRTLFTPPHLAMTGRRLLSATETRSGTDNIVVAGNPLAGMGLTLRSSRLLYARLTAADGLGLDAAAAAGYWFYGDPTRAFAYMENWPITVVQAAANSEAEFTQDIVLRYKASERGAAAVLEPRTWQRHCASATSSSGT